MATNVTFDLKPGLEKLPSIFTQSAGKSVMGVQQQEQEEQEQEDLGEMELRHLAPTHR